MRVLVATSNAGKLRDFSAAGVTFGDVQVLPLPGFGSLPAVEENGVTFKENARKKAIAYSRFAGGEIVLADDSGLEVFALDRAPGVRSARYAADAGIAAAGNSQADIDAANNQHLLTELGKRVRADRSARFVCALAAARDGQVLETFEGEVRGEILLAPRGHSGFGYDPLFFVPGLGKTLAEVSAEKKASVSHRGQAFRKFLEWLPASA